MLNHWGSGGAGRSLGGDDLLLGRRPRLPRRWALPAERTVDDRQADGAELVVLGRGGEPLTIFRRRTRAWVRQRRLAQQRTRRRGGVPYVVQAGDLSSWLQQPLARWVHAGPMRPSFHVEGLCGRSRHRPPEPGRRCARSTPTNRTGVLPAPRRRGGSLLASNSGERVGGNVFSASCQPFGPPDGVDPNPANSSGISHVGGRRAPRAAAPTQRGGRH